MVKTYGVTTVEMESTSVYWIPAYEVLEGHGFEVILVNARYAKNVTGRKGICVVMLTGDNRTTAEAIAQAGN